MAINLMAIEPHQVSRDLSGYITYIYGPAKAGKTTLSVQMPKSLLLAFERGYNALPGVMVQDILTWSEMKQTLRELKKPEVKERFSTIVIDTVDIAAQVCEKYMCNQLGIDSIGDGGWSVNGWAKVKKEFDETFRTIAQLGYALVFISHDKEATFKKQDGTEYTMIKPSLSTAYNSIVENMADLYGYMHPVLENGQTTVKITLRSTDGSIRAGGRFAYIPAEINSSYDELVKALNEAIDAESRIKGAQFITDDKQTPSLQKELNFDELMTEFNVAIENLQNRMTKEKFETEIAPKIVQITDRYLGKGKKVSLCTRDQVEQLELIVLEIKDL